MSRTNTLLSTLQELKASGAFPQRMLVRDVSVAATVEMDVHQLDRLSIELSMIRVTPEKSATFKLGERATLLAGKVTGLMETLNVIEIDDSRGEALLRSDVPLAEDTKRLYYELLVQQNGTTTLHRYQGSMVKTSRQEIPFSLTREALAKLIQDVAE